MESTVTKLKNAEEIENEARDTHYVQVPLSLSQKELSDAANVFLSFLTLPQDIKDSLIVPGGQEHNYGLLGYKQRSKKMNNSDNKEFFHYHPRFEEYIEKNPHTQIPQVRALLEASRRIDEAATETLYNFLSILSEKFPGVLDEYFPPTGRRTVLRFLKYDVAGKENFLARAHYDAGGCTLALAESAPGLRLGTTDKDLSHAQRDLGMALFMPALHFHKKTSTAFHPVWHDVVQVSDDTFSNSIARWAIVFFADGDSQKERPSSEETMNPRRFF